jgi:CHAT domain-containing protein
MRALYDVLIRPSARSLQAARTLIVVPDRALQNVPLAALTDRESNVRLVERFAVAIAPRASALRTAQPRSTPLSLLAVALPSGETAGSAALPEGEREIREIGRHYDEASLLARESATFQSFGSAAPRASVIHLAGHTQRRGERDAAFVFAGGERLSWRTIAAIPVAHDGIVVLAGCETLRAADTHEATKSLGEAFLAAGARAVIGTLAPIADRDARALFAALHRRLAAGIDETEALRRVQLESIHDGSAWQSVTLLTTRIPPG